MSNVNERDWRNHIGWEFPYKGHTMSNPQYIKDKTKLFAENGNGWWCNDGTGWSMDEETPAEKMRRYKQGRYRNEL